MTNDYELIYLVQSYQDGVALECIIKKYERMIWKYIYYYGVEPRDREDYFQEGLIVLWEVVNSFDESKGKTFTRYFELVLKRVFYRLKEKQEKLVLYEQPDFLKTNSYIEEEVEMSMPKASKFEDAIYELYFKQKRSIAEIAKIMVKTEKQVYNAIFRIKKKIKDKIESI